MDAQYLLDSLLAVTFRTSAWHKMVATKGANPIFFGKDLSEDTNSPKYLAVASVDFTGDYIYEQAQQDLKFILSQAKCVNKNLCEYQFGNITLNLWEPLKGDDHTQVSSFDKLFRVTKDGLETCVLYFNHGRGAFQKLSIQGHQLPWKTAYELQLDRCRNANAPSREVRWTVTQSKI